MARSRASSIELSDAERVELERQVRRRTAPQGAVLRARIVLRAAEGMLNTVIAEELGIGPHTVGKWRERFVRDRLDGLSDEPRPRRRAR